MEEQQKIDVKHFGEELMISCWIFHLSLGKYSFKSQ